MARHAHGCLLRQESDNGLQQATAERASKGSRSARVHTGDARIICQLSTLSSRRPPPSRPGRNCTTARMSAMAATPNRPYREIICM